MHVVVSKKLPGTLKQFRVNKLYTSNLIHVQKRFPGPCRKDVVAAEVIDGLFLHIPII